jgi:hypothetical protein
MIYILKILKSTYLNIRACFQLLIIINKHLVNYIIIKSCNNGVFKFHSNNFNCTFCHLKKKESCLNKQCKNKKHEMDRKLITKLPS